MNPEPQSNRSSPATAQLIALGEQQSAPGAAPAAVSGSNVLHAIRTRLEVCVGEVEMTVGELLAARENEVVALRSPVEEPVELRLNGSVVARGELVAIGGRFGFRITELPSSLAL